MQKFSIILWRTLCRRLVLLFYSPVLTLIPHTRFMHSQKYHPLKKSVNALHFFYSSNFISNQQIHAFWRIFQLKKSVKVIPLFHSSFISPMHSMLIYIHHKLTSIPISIPNLWPTHAVVDNNHRGVGLSFSHCFVRRLPWLRFLLLLCQGTTSLHIYAPHLVSSNPASAMLQ